MKVAVVTGAARGLGRQIAITLRSCGYAVVINYNRSLTEANELAELLGDTTMALQADVKSLSEMGEMAEKVKSRWGRVDALINNAGITKDCLLMNYRESDLDEVLRVNLKGCFNAVKAFAPLMIKSGGGHIINVSSRSGVKGKAGQAAYSASKGGVLGFTIVAAQELSAHNIRVNALLPGYMPTGMGRAAEKSMEEAKADSLLKRLSDPEEVSRFIAYLLTTRGITGQVFGLESRV
ncbi:MAG TPA: SDR family NAD(P)-dependent oxidoreductase [Thermodesulfovibrionales bacterium]|nr:SDR family NAD(P)-dependent oxidoreductase [Thermodesulfovibrionales bacterium]